MRILEPQFRRVMPWVALLSFRGCVPVHVSNVSGSAVPASLEIIQLNDFVVAGLLQVDHMLAWQPLKII